MILEPDNSLIQIVCLNIHCAGVEPVTSQQQETIDFNTDPALRLVPVTTSEGKMLSSAVENKAFLVAWLP